MAEATDQTVVGTGVTCPTLARRIGDRHRLPGLVEARHPRELRLQTRPLLQLRTPRRHAEGLRHLGVRATVGHEPLEPGARVLTLREDVKPVIPAPRPTPDGVVFYGDGRSLRRYFETPITVR